MGVNRGKQFEEQLKRNFIATVPHCSIDRIYDSVNGFHGVSNISDFIAYSKPFLFYLECKSHKGASLPLDNITQYEKLKYKIGIPGVRCGVVLWLIEKDIVMYIPISTIKLLREEGEKSVGIRHLDKYNIKVLPSVKKRVLLDTDYSSLIDLKDGE